MFCIGDTLRIRNTLPSQTIYNLSSNGITFRTLFSVIETGEKKVYVKHLGDGRTFWMFSRTLENVYLTNLKTILE